MGSSLMKNKILLQLGVNYRCLQHECSASYDLHPNIPFGSNVEKSSLLPPFSPQFALFIEACRLVTELLDKEISRALAFLTPLFLVKES